MALTLCQECSGEISSQATTCPHCGDPIGQTIAVRRRRYRRAARGSAKLALAGIALLIGGCFVPVVSLPLVGGVNLYANGDGDGVIVIGIAAASLLLVWWQKYGPLLLAGLAAGGIVGYDFYQVTAGLSSPEGEAFAGIVQMQWGWAVLFAGAALLIVAAVKR